MFKIVKAPNPILRNEAKPVKKLTPKYLQIIDEMITTTKSFQDPEGIGLAATQVGIPEQFFIAKFDLDLKEKLAQEEINESTHDLKVGVSSLDRTSSGFEKPTTSQSRFYRDKTLANTQITIQFPDEFTAVFNPKINWSSKRVKVTMEGCLSIPNYYSPISRPSYIKVSYTNINGQIVHKSLKGMNATIFQHEYDHLHGRLFMDYVIAQKTKLFKITGKDKAGADIYEEVSI